MRVANSQHFDTGREFSTVWIGHACQTVIVEVARPWLEPSSLEFRPELGLGVRVVLEPLVIIPNEVESSIDVGATQPAWV